MNFTKATSIKTCEQLLAEFNAGGTQVLEARKLIFEGTRGRDVYNITAPFVDADEWIIAGRVEDRDSEESEIMFFMEREGRWIPRPGAPVLKLQDPFHTKIGGELVLGGVETYPHPESKDMLMWRTVFYKGRTIGELERFFQGPEGMKDLRLVELEHGAIGVFTRPQGKKGGRGKIGYVSFSSLNDLSISVIENAPLLENQFADEEWGGSNEIHRLDNGWLGVLSHIACYDAQGDRHYYPAVFIFDPETGDHTEMKLLAVRASFESGPAKRPDLQDVVFSGGLIRSGDGEALLYAGTSDAEAQWLKMADPFADIQWSK